MAAYMVFTREKTRNAAALEQYKKLVPPSFQRHPATIRTRLRFAPFVAVMKFWKGLPLKTSLFSSSRATKRQKPGIKVRSIRQHANGGSREETTGAFSPTE